MNKSDLIIELAKSYPFLNKEQMTQLVDIVFQEMVEALAAGKRIEIRGFGAMSVRERKVQKQFFQKEEKNISFEKKNAIYFRIGKEFFDHIN